MSSRTLQCLSVAALFGAARGQAPTDGPQYIDTQMLSYLGYIMFSVFLSIACAALLYLCLSVPTKAISVGQNLWLQIPNVRWLLKSDLRQIDLTMAEAAACMGYGELAHNSQAFMVWRRTQLSMAFLLNIALLVINVIVLNDNKAFDIKVERDEIVADSYTLRDRAREQLLQLIPLAQVCIAMLFTGASAWNWAAYKQSIRITVLGWLLVFFIPFLYFFVPWMDIVSPKEHVQGLCTSLLDALAGIFDDEMVLNDGGVVDVKSVCSRGIKDMADTIQNGMKIIDKNTGDTRLQLVLTFVGLLLQYIIYLPFLLGAVEALKNLGPGVLGMLMGLQGGLKMSKLMFPGLRVTSWMLIILQASALPVVMCLMALLLVVVGTIPVMFTAIFVTAAMSLYIVFSNQLLSATTRDESIAVMTRLTRISLVLMLLGLGCLVLGVYLAEHLVALSDMGVGAIKRFLKPLTIAKLVVKTLAGMFVSKVMFVDIVLHIIISTYIGVYEDDAAARREIFGELTSFGKLFPQYTAYNKLDEMEMGSTGTKLIELDTQPASPHLLSISHGPASTYSPPKPFTQMVV